jgi:hypothetical protein
MQKDYCLCDFETNYYFESMKLDDEILRLEAEIRERRTMNICFKEDPKTYEQQSIW